MKLPRPILSVVEEENISTDWTNRFNIGDTDEECVPPEIDSRSIHTCLRCGGEFVPHDYINVKVYDRKLDGTWGISHFCCWENAEREKKSYTEKKDNARK